MDMIHYQSLEGKPHVSYRRNLESFQGPVMYLISCIKTMMISSELLENTT